jgi:hypothetical protein
MAFRIMIKFIVLIVGILWPKDKRKVIFSEWFGMSHVDSPFYLFLYGNRSSHLKCFWITKSISEYEELSMLYKNVLYSKSLKGIWIQSTSYTIVSSVSAKDFFWPALLRKKNYIQLGHGMPYKASYGLRYSKIVRFKNFLRRLTIDNYSYVGSAGSNFDDLLAKQYFVDSERILRMPVVRCLRLANCDTWTRSNSCEKVIFYMPTHRDEGKSFSDIRKTIDTLRSFIRSMPTYRLFVKLHHYDQKWEREFIDDTDFELVTGDYYSVLKNANIFIGDYSGVLWDSYHVSNQLRIAFIPNFTKYIETYRDIYFVHEETYDIVCKDRESLFNALLSKGQSSNENICIDNFIEFRNLEILDRVGFEQIKKTIR